MVLLSPTAVLVSIANGNGGHGALATLGDSSRGSLRSSRRPKMEALPAKQILRGRFAITVSRLNGLPFRLAVAEVKLVRGVLLDQPVQTVCSVILTPLVATEKQRQLVAQNVDTLIGQLLAHA